VDPTASLLPVLKRLAIEVTDLRRQQSAMRLALAGIDPEGVELLHVTPGHTGRTPEVSVIMPAFNQETDIKEALESLLKSDCEEWEVVVVDDGSRDATRAVVTDFFTAHPEVAGQLFGATANHGIGWTRNRAIERARAESLFMLDGDNAVYPRTLSRLLEALRDDPGAAMAYPVVGTHTPSGPEGLISHMAWRPELFATGVNPVDAMVLVRRSVMSDLGGFAEDPRLGGLEDYDLWCRLASHGMYGISVPELLGWYRRSKHSALSIADLDRTEALSLISRRAPNLFSES
jgi:glycosyltransferase involved in cell wall biosynthesis